MSKNRQRRQAEDLRNKILEISQRIVLDEGLEALSIRRVAKEMDYTAPIIYHYFRDKNELLSCCVREGYKKILESVELPEPGLPPDEEMRISFRNFIDSAMLIPNAYRSFILQTSSDLLVESTILGKGALRESPTLAKLVSQLEDGIELGIFAPCNVRLTSRVLWTANFGLFFRLIVEPELSQDEREALVNRHLDITMKGLAAERQVTSLPA